MKLTEEQKSAIGKRIADMLYASKEHPAGKAWSTKGGRWVTSYGTKTDLGVAECVLRIIEEETKPVKERKRNGKF